MAPSIPMDPVILKQNAHQQRAYMTFLAGNGEYVKGVVGLAKGLRKVKSAYPLVVAVMPDVPEEHKEILRSQGCIMREIEPVYPPDDQVSYARDYYIINYSKLRIWNVSMSKSLQTENQSTFLYMLKSKFLIYFKLVVYRVQQGSVP